MLVLYKSDCTFTSDCEVDVSFCEPSLFFSNYLFNLEFEPIQDGFQYDFAWMTDEVNGSVILAEL